MRDVEGVGGEKFLRAYLRDGEKVYQTTDRGIEVLVNTLGLLDRTVFGRQETWEDSPTDWPQPDAASGWWRRDGRPIDQWAHTAQPAIGRTSTIAVDRRPSIDRRPALGERGSAELGQNFGQLKGSATDLEIEIAGTAEVRGHPRGPADEAHPG